MDLCVLLGTFDVIDAGVAMKLLLGLLIVSTDLKVCLLAMK